MTLELKLDFYPAPNPNRTGVLVLPGGGYEFISLEKEGVAPAQWLNDRNIDAWVLSYTIADESSNPAPIFPAPQREALEAVRRVRASGRVERLGIWGFSAGGHLAAVTATDPGVELDFVILAYPVISMVAGTTHEGSRRNLIGDGCEAGSDVENAMCAEKRVTESTPPTFLFHTANDDTVPVQNALGFALAMAKYDRPFQILVLPDGPHGLGLALDDARLSWTGELERWLKGSVLNGLLVGLMWCDSLWGLNGPEEGQRKVVLHPWSPKGSPDRRHVQREPTKGHNEDADIVCVADVPFPCLKNLPFEYQYTLDTVRAFAY
ncbi:Alpha/Beta hydrolase protein [Hypoxylon sp. FL0890]|nr:Alpha/Beta hydrolase protein [Hypoxylon sp. FL0890]